MTDVRCPKGLGYRTSDIGHRYDCAKKLPGPSPRRHVRQMHRDLVTRVPPRAPGAVEPHLEGKAALLHRGEAHTMEEPGDPGEREHFGEAQLGRALQHDLHQIQQLTLNTRTLTTAPSNSPCRC